MKHISILGSTGSIGTQTLDVISHYPDQFKVVGLAGGIMLSCLWNRLTNFVLLRFQ